mgnify:CR=1 FL=1
MTEALRGRQFALFGEADDNARQANQAYNAMTVHLSNLPVVAKQLLGQTGPAIQAQQVAKIAQDASKIQQGVNVKVNTADLVAGSVTGTVGFTITYRALCGAFDA